MLEAVNSVLSNASYTKVIADQQSVATSYAANPDRVQQASLQAPYLSLYIKVDVNFDKAILQMRDNESGDVLRQIPSESQLEAYRRAQTSNAVRPSEAKGVVDTLVPDNTSDGEAPPVQAASPAPAPEVKVSEASPSLSPSSSPAPVSIDTQA